MVEKLICGISSKVSDVFGDEFTVYTESVHQNAVKPCFFVECESMESVGLLGGRFLLRVNVKITFENDSETQKYEADKMISDMFELLGKVKADGVLLLGRKINGKREKGSLVIRAVYDIWPNFESGDNAVMESIEVSGIYDGEREIYKG